MEDAAGVEAALLAPVAGGIGNRAWRPSEAFLKWMMLGVLTFFVMSSIGLLTVGSFSYQVWVKTMSCMDAKAWKGALFASAGDLTTLFLIFSPLDSFVEISRVGNVGDRIHVSNVAAVINCGIWTWYGAALKTVNYSVVLTNLTGAAFHVGYLGVYFKCCRGRRAFFFTWVGVGGAFALAMVATCLCLKSAGSDLSHVVGLSGLLTGVLMYSGAAAENMLVAHRTNGQEGKTGLLATTLNAGLWTVYAVIIEDIIMLFPNALGLFLCACQVIQRLVYRFWMPAGELYARLVGALNAMVANGAAAAADNNNAAAAAADNNGGEP